MRSIAQNRFTAVGRVPARVSAISSNSARSSAIFVAFESRTPRATPIAAATPMAGAPRMTIERIAPAMSRYVLNMGYSSTVGSFRWSIILTPSSVHSIVFTITGYSSIMKGCVISAPMTGSGKTTVTLGLLSALRKRGITVQPFKVGPDFIDPGLHELAAGLPSHNLDGWMLTREANQWLFARACEGKDVAVVEGVMGLFDGFEGKSETGSTAEMAKWLDLPVILVIDAHPMARSAAAIIRGFQSFDPGLKIAGVILNRVAGEKHFRMIEDAVRDVRILGWLLANPSIEIPERHLGLLTAKEEVTALRVRAIGDFFDAHIDIANILDAVGAV